jgi:hypothetical protein
MMFLEASPTEVDAGVVSRRSSIIEGIMKTIYVGRGLVWIASGVRWTRGPGKQIAAKSSVRSPIRDMSRYRLVNN